MAIDPTNNSSNNVRPLNRTIGDQSSVRSQRGTRADSGQPSASPESTRFTRAAQADSSQDIDTARVAEIRQGIANGTLTFDSDRIADGIIASARELAGRD